MPTKTIAFFGATGGCTNACLAYLIKSNLDYKAVALARTPQKLKDSLIRQGFTDAVISKKLTIIQGDATDVSDVKRVLLFQQQNGGTRLVDGIVSGLGGSPMIKEGTWFSVTIDNPNVTEQTTTTLVTALKDLYSENDNLKNSKPFVTVISTTGLASENEKEDVPFFFRTLYHYFLAVPHADKRRMEEIVGSTENKHLFKGVVITKPSLLTGDGSLTAGKGLAKVRSGTEDQPAVGYFITRTDVGEWIWEEVCKKGGSEWFGRKVSLTN
ncbi:hypothetical protein BGW36DRAFT_368389 [Talaromyces proteolyticus]|uniref:NAD(P)-binding domain-containing protein n=1 Tax=Talaromyces proteolyticus TaxID=1131652 RepID=A0AAD4L3I5_9EURO|nr:uncharacterized protein BGW36DRAFT_368389 [Talaromyces proteolyticus]KAH8705921.1 hypothetical protein BGW36DRAFT_368389 [Talaromyces proteolyticus]